MSWAATTASHSGDIVRDVMLAAVENRFGDELHKPSEIEWLSDNGELHGRRHAPVRSGHRPEAIDRTGVQPPKQWDGRALREDDEMQLRRLHAEAGRSDCCMQRGHRVRASPREASS